ncbi:MAG: DegT/DnrJ/EryC1/StrS family aminotransferase [Candidatus Saccharibacteria bacterium]
MQWRVPYFDLKLDEDDKKAVREVLDSNWLTMGAATQEFETRFADLLKVKHSLAVSNCTVALHLANILSGIGPGDEVICPALTFVATANAVLYTGGVPIFADITSETDWTISPDSIVENITPRTKAIIVVHYGGYPCDMQEIMKIAQENNLTVIEDCAHALVTEYDGKFLGTFGKFGCFSFFGNKNMTTAEGGMIITNDDSAAERVKLLRSHGMTNLTLDRFKGHAFSYDVVDLGYNYRIDEMRAALGVSQLNKLSYNNARRHQIVKLYCRLLEDVDELVIPFTDKMDNASSHIFPVLLPEGSDRFGVMTRLKELGVQTSIHYKPIHLFDHYVRNKIGNNRPLPKIESLWERILTLPLYPGMLEADVEYVASSLKDALGS